MAYKTDELRYAVYARHGDICGCESQGVRDCGSRMKYGDYVLVARFAYLTEAIDHAQMVAARGVHAAIRSKRYGQRGFDVSLYPVNAAPSSKPHAIAEHVAG